MYDLFGLANNAAIVLMCEGQTESKIEFSRLAVSTNVCPKTLNAES